MGSNTPLRHRSKAQKPPSSQSTSLPDLPPSPPKSSTPLLTLPDILRVISTLIALTLSASYYLTSGESLIFHQPRPWYTQPSQVRAFFAGPLSLTPVQLSAYAGVANAGNPRARILLSLNHTLFDVSASPHLYGPGGSYAVMAGRDATRAFVTGCFKEDSGRGADLRGVDRMFLPVEDLSVEEEWDVTGGKGEGGSSGGRKGRREREGREARKRVRDEVQRWVGFYSGSQKYFKVGELVGWEEMEGRDLGEEEREKGGLCKAAEEGRRKRSVLLKEAKEEKEEGKRKVGGFKSGSGKGGKPV